MKLLNPTDAELNCAFAEKVAGMKPSPINPGLFRECGALGSSTDSQPPRFTTSADAVLPWLNKHAWYAKYAGMAVLIGISEHTAEAESFSRSATICLLRAHGVTVEAGG